MESRYNEPLENIMSLIVAKTPRAKVLANAREVKVMITKDWSDAQQAITFLDGMVNRYTPDEDWPQGFWLPPQLAPAPRPFPAPAPRPLFAPGFVQPGQRPASIVTRPERILEIARGVITEGTVVTKTVINQLRAEGDQRPETSLAVSIGNVLTRHGWHRIGPGKYQLTKEHEDKEVK